jgi:hypothetical protein
LLDNKDGEDSTEDKSKAFTDSEGKGSANDISQVADEHKKETSVEIFKIKEEDLDKYPRLV